MLPGDADAGLGGAVCVLGTSRARVSNCVLYHNWSFVGGGLFSDGGYIVVDGNIITGNEAYALGGGLALGNETTPSYPGLIVNNVIADNSAPEGGGIAFYNCVFDPENPATDKLGNNTIVGNTASTSGGGITYLEGSSLRLRNSILWNNSSPVGAQVYLEEGCAPEFRYCDVQGGLAGFGGAAFSGVYEGCLDADPLFSGDSTHPWCPWPWSVCVNRGEENSALSAHDLKGNPRAFDSPGGAGALLDNILDRVDLGAYESQLDNGVVPYGQSFAGNESLGHDLTVPPGIVFEVAPGSTLSFAPLSGLSVYGSLRAPGLANSRIAFTAQNESQGWDGLAFLGEAAVPDSSWLIYCNLSHGVTGAGDQPYGGLVLVDGYDRLNLSNCVLSQGSAQKGGALAVLNSSAEFYGSELHHNSAPEGGGAVYLQDADPLLAHFTIVENASTTGPGAVLASNSGYARLFGCNIWNNGPTPLGGTMLVLYCNVQGGHAGSSNMNEDPRFDPAATDHYTLTSTSPCMNRGIVDPGNYPNLPLTDIVGNPRVHAHTQSSYDRPDIGAHEYPGLMDPTDFVATDGNNDYPGHVYLSWNYSSSYLPNNGFQIFRDGSLLVTLFPHITSYADYSAIPGNQHAYTLLAYAGGETSNPIIDTGYIKPNGIITGTVKTPNNNPVSGVNVSLSPSGGYCLQFGSGSYFAVPVPDTDLADSFTLEAWVRTAGADCSLLFKLDPSESRVCQLRLDPQGYLLYTDGLSSLAQEAGAAVNDNAWHHAAVSYDAAAGNGRLYLDGTCVADSALAFTDLPGGSLHVDEGALFTGFMDDIRLWSLARNAEQILDHKNLIPAWNSPGLAGYWPMNEGTGASAFDATNNAHIASTNAAWSAAEPGILLGGVSDNWGDYVISQIPYGNYTTFTVTPSKPGHMFQPEQRLVTLSQSNISADNVDFIDNSMIPISGHVMFYGTVCPVAGATVWLNGAQAVPFVMTDPEGYYVLEVEHGTDCLVSMQYRDHPFDRDWDLGVVTYPRTNIDFNDTFTTDLFVQVVGGADSWPLGEFDVSLNSLNGLYSREVTGQEWYTGMILIPYLPPLDFNVTVNPGGADPFNLMVNPHFQSIKTKHLDLTGADAVPDTLRYEWRADLQAEVAWPQGYELKYLASDPGQQFGFRVAEQNEWIELQVRAFEDYTLPGYPPRRTWLTGCGIHITDDVGPIGETEDSFGGEQIYSYRFAPYLPNILDGGDRPYQNLLEITIHDAELERYASVSDWVVTQGARPTESTYATTSPEIPFLILHDPPGDKSYSSFRESSSHSVAMSVSYSSAELNGGYEVSHLGLNIESGIGILYSIQTEIDFTLDISYGYSVRVTQGSAYETCLTFTTAEEYRTSDQGQLIGRESDLYVGGAVNLIWGLTRELAWNDTTQAITLTDGVMVVPNGFNTIYMFTEAQILNNVIPNLIAIGDTVSAARWQSYVAMNAANVANAVENPNHPSNLSFNAGAGYLYEETASSSSSYTFSYDTVTSEEFGLDIGLVVNGLGIVGGYQFESAITIGSSSVYNYQTDTSISYMLADDDETSYLNYQPDYFTVDVKKDPVYGTPVFDLLAGASSNRWEPHTMPRDGVSLSANAYTASGLQEDETAAFLLNLGNTSQTQEDRRYFLCLRHETNPGGAVVLINGLPVVERIPFNVPAGQQVQAVMTVARGPLAYEYEGITLEFYAEGDRGNPGPDGHHFWVTKSFNVYWEPPYSRVSIAWPEDGWIINQDSHNGMEVMLRDYDLDKPDFSSLLLQYRQPSSSDWLPALEIPRDSLLAHPEYVIVTWDVSSLADGPYQIRAGTTDNIQEDYYTASLNGVIDRSPPLVWGLPQPADGILQLGDLISVTFTEDINPVSITPGTVSLVVLRTLAAIDVNAQVNGSALAIVPLVANYWLENETLRVTVQGLKDSQGNQMPGPVAWEFFVNANPVYWTQPMIELIKPLGQPATVTAQLHNSGGQQSSFTLTGLPQWLSASVNSGSLLPLESQTIAFSISDQLGYGVFRDTVFADIPALGREPLAFEVSVLADPPAWATGQFGNYDYSMTITGQLFLEGGISTDNNDVIGAFLYDPATHSYACRGAAALATVPYLENCHQFFLTIYNDTDEAGELVFRVWDSSTCKEHIGIQESFSFSDGAYYGTPVAPVIIHVEPDLISSSSCRAGWNWISVNLDNSASMNVNDVLASLNPSANDIVKSQTVYAQYVPSLGWVGALQTISTLRTYKVRLAQPGVLTTTGLLEDPAANPISYGSGWNWIGYLPHVSLSVNEAMANLPNAVTGDLVKGQNSYSQYVAGYGWFGSMLFMQPGKGHMLRTANGGSFTYPQYSIPREEQEDAYAARLEKLRELCRWEFDPLDYEYSSNITATILQDGEPLQGEDILLGAFYGDECRGVAIPVWVIDKWVYFLTQYSNVLNQMLTYKAYLPATGETFALAETLPFVNNQVLGDPLNPYQFHVAQAELGEPRNLTLEIAGASLTLSWDECAGADYYKVFASDDPEGGFLDVTSQGTFGRITGAGASFSASGDGPAQTPPRTRISWTCGLPNRNRYFYQVRAGISGRR
jgi:hypothetical protein